MNRKCYGTEPTDVILPRKALTTISNKYLYPKPTQVGRGKYPKVNERTFVKEFDNLTP